MWINYYVSSNGDFVLCCMLDRDFNLVKEGMFYVLDSGNNGNNE